MAHKNVEPTQSYFKIWSILHNFVWLTYLFLSGLATKIQPKWFFCLINYFQNFLGLPRFGIGKVDKGILALS